MTHRLSARLAAAAPSATAEVFKRVSELRAQGVELLSLSVGEPDFDPPASVRRAAASALDAGPFGYTQVAGLAALREAICAESLARRGVVHAPDDVVVSAGAKHALFNVAQALYEPGDEVIIPTPSWVSYAEQVRLCGATPVLVPCSDADDFLLTPDALRAALAKNTKAVILCTPSNPTGAAYDEAQLRALAEVLRPHDCYVVVDEIYAELCYDGFVATSILTVAPFLRERLILVDGVSKTYAMTGFRVGWMLGPRAIARACETFQSQVTTSISTTSQLAALAALRGDKSEVAEMKRAYAERRRRMLDGLRAIPGLRVTTPRGAFYAFVDVRSLIGKTHGAVSIASDVDVPKLLLEQKRVAVVPGSAFAGPGYLRLSYAASLTDIDEALARLGQLVAECR